MHNQYTRSLQRYLCLLCKMNQLGKLGMFNIPQIEAMHGEDFYRQAHRTVVVTVEGSVESNTWPLQTFLQNNFPHPNSPD